MRALLDAHTALWILTGDHRLGPVAASVENNPDCEVLLSSVVVWEIAIKRSLGKLQSPDDFAHQLLRGGAIALPVTIEHAERVATLPWHHRDPFDRLLVAQAIVEDAVIVSADERLRAYDARVAW